MQTRLFMKALTVGALMCLALLLMSPAVMANEQGLDGETIVTEDVEAPEEEPVEEEPVEEEPVEEEFDGYYEPEDASGPVVPEYYEATDASGNYQVVLFGYKILIVPASEEGGTVSVGVFKVTETGDEEIVVYDFSGPLGKAVSVVAKAVSPGPGHGKVVSTFVKTVSEQRTIMKTAEREAKRAGQEAAKEQLQIEKEEAKQQRAAEKEEAEQQRAAEKEARRLEKEQNKNTNTEEDDGAGNGKGNGQNK